MTAIMEIAEKHNLIVIEDSAETIGGTHNGQLTGSFAIGCFSFYPTKNLTTGEGGMLTTNDDELAHEGKSSIWPMALINQLMNGKIRKNPGSGPPAG